MERKYRTHHLSKSIDLALSFAVLHGCMRIDAEVIDELDEEAFDVCEDQPADPILGHKSQWERIYKNPNGDNIRIMLKNGQVFELTLTLLGEVDTEGEEERVMEQFLPLSNGTGMEKLDH